MKSITDLDYDNLNFVVDNQISKNNLQVDNEPEIPKTYYTSSGKVFEGYKTSRALAHAVAKYNPKTAGDIQDILCGVLSEETDYYLSEKTDTANLNSDNYIYMPAFIDLEADIAFYLNIE